MRARVDSHAATSPPSAPHARTKVAISSGPGSVDRRSVVATMLGGRVPPARLVRALWGERPPASARAQVHNHVSALRRDVDVRRVAEGYRLDVAGGALDLAEFDAAVAAARTVVTDGGGDRQRPGHRAGAAAAARWGPAAPCW
ncbi:hypothetical protein SUDANB95_02555 [Actinosynnema sp. ALI-1.44]